MSDEMIGTTEAAERLRVTPGRVRQLILEGRLPAHKIGKTWVISEADLDLVRNRPPGRPPKQRAKDNDRAA